MRIGFPVLAVLALAACEPAVPDSAAGVGFDTYSDYAAQRETALRQDVTVRAPQTVAAAPQGEGASIAAEAVAALRPETATAAPLSQMAPQAEAPAAVPATDHAGISDEQSFAAVSSRETIQSDKERLAAQREQYQVIAPEPLPGRTGSSGPNIVQYALNAPNRVGQPQYRRPGGVSQERMARNCAKYGADDRAQEAFLEAGGPKSDRLGLDPDGDGFACYWDPAPFRAALR